jgi:HK97 family phage prohead protease
MKENFVTKLEIKELTEAGTFSGLASVYGITDSDNDIVASGAFAKSLVTRPDVKLLWQHDRTKPIGIFTLIEERGNALYVEGKLAIGVEKADEAYILLKMGAISGLSIGFVTKNYDYDTTTNVRTISEAELYEISVVTFPANEAAHIMSVKNIKDMPPKEVERKLRTAFNLSQSEAKTFMAKGYSAISQRDVVEAEESQRDVGSELLNQLKEINNEIGVSHLGNIIKNLTI